MGSYIVYADVLLLLNFVLDLFLLWGSGRFLKREILFRRLIPAASMGAVYGSLLVFPIAEWIFSMPVVFVCSLVMLFIAFPFGSKRALLRLTTVFYLMAFAMGGAALAGANILQQQPVAPGILLNVRSLALLFGLILCLILGRKGLLAVKRFHRKEEYRAKLKIGLGDRSCFVRALIDTGNDLRDPISDLPVVVVAADAVSQLFSAEVGRILRNSEKDPVHAFQQLQQNCFQSKFRLIPFASIGKKHGLLLGFKPDRLLLYKDGGTWTGNAIICITSAGLSSGEFRAILNPEVLDYPLAGEASA